MVFLFTGRMCSYFSFIPIILCGLCSHSSSRAAEMLQRLLRGPFGPLLGPTWTGTTSLVMLSNVSIDGQETCWAAFPRRGSSSPTQPEPKLNQAWTGDEGCGFCWQQSVSCCESDSGRGSVSTNYWRISNDDDDGRALACAPSGPACWETQQMLRSSRSRAADDNTVTSLLQLNKVALICFHSTSADLNKSVGFIWTIFPIQLGSVYFSASAKAG